MQRGENAAAEIGYVDDMADHSPLSPGPRPKALVVDPREDEQRPDQIDTISPGLTDESALAGSERPAADSVR